MVDVQWGFMKVDANATHVAMEVRLRPWACACRRQRAGWMSAGPPCCVPTMFSEAPAFEC